MDHRVSFALKWIHENFRAALELREISSKCGLSISQFYNLFRSETGITPAAYIRKLRYQRASELLVDSNLSVKEITGAVGIRDVSHFVRTFHEIHGLSPMAYRRERRMRALHHQRSIEPGAQHSGVNPQPPLSNWNSAGSDQTADSRSSDTPAANPAKSKPLAS
jgi:AraC-like DNA-binding protein